MSFLTIRDPHTRLPLARGGEAIVDITPDSQVEGPILFGVCVWVHGFCESMKYLEFPTLLRFDSCIVSVPISNGAVERLGTASLMNPFISDGCYDILCSCKTARPTTRVTSSMKPATPQ